MRWAPPACFGPAPHHERFTYNTRNAEPSATANRLRLSLSLGTFGATHHSMKHALLALVIAFSFPALCHSGEKIPPPEVIGRGFDAYLKSGAGAAFDEWNIYSDSESKRSKALATFQQVETAFGKLIGWELIRVVTLSDSVCCVYLTAKYQQGPLFMAFDCYKSKEWSVVKANANSDPTEVLPGNILGGQ
jgi:hypothetical protein